MALLIHRTRKYDENEILNQVDMWIGTTRRSKDLHKTGRVGSYRAIQQTGRVGSYRAIQLNDQGKKFEFEMFSDLDERDMQIVTESLCKQADVLRAMMHDDADVSTSFSNFTKFLFYIADHIEKIPVAMGGAFLLLYRDHHYYFNVSTETYPYMSSIHWATVSADRRQVEDMDNARVSTELILKAHKTPIVTTEYAAFVIMSSIAVTKDMCLWHVKRSSDKSELNVMTIMDCTPENVHEYNDFNSYTPLHVHQDSIASGMR